MSTEDRSFPWCLDGGKSGRKVAGSAVLDLGMLAFMVCFPHSNRTMDFLHTNMCIYDRKEGLFPTRSSRFSRDASNTKHPPTELIRLLSIHTDQRPIARFPHLLSDPFFEIFILLRDLLYGSQVFLNGLLDDCFCDMDADFSYIDDIGHEAFVWIFESRGLSCDGLDGRDEHFVGEEAGATQDGAETDAGEGG